MQQRPVKKAMILAAGLGTRLKPFTDRHPKALAVINGKSLLQRNIGYLQSHGIYEVVVNTHHFAEQIEETVLAHKGWGSEVTISYEKDILETGGGLKYASRFLLEEENFVMMNADVLTDLPLGDMIGQHLALQPLATLAVSRRNTSRYLLFTGDEELCGWRNTKTGEIRMVRGFDSYSEKAFSGIHIIHKNIFPAMEAFTGKFSIIDVYLQLASVNPLRSFSHDDSLFIDVGKPESLTVAGSLFT